MTFRERLEKEHPECVSDDYIAGCKYCPCDYGYELSPPCGTQFSCRSCWNRQMPMTPEEQEQRDLRINSVGEILLEYCDQYQCTNCPANRVCDPTDGNCWDAPDYNVPKQMAVLNAFESALPPLDEDDAERTDTPQNDHCAEHDQINHPSQPMQHDAVNHPSHYTSGKVECIDAIESAIHAMQGERAFLTGQVIKYLWRWPLKNGVEDLRKARWYLDRLIKFVEDMDAEQKRN